MNPLRDGPVVDPVQNPRVRLLPGGRMHSFQGVAAVPVHDNTIFAQQLGDKQKLANRYTTADLIHKVALPQCFRHGRKIAKPAVAIVLKLPSVTGEELRESWPKVVQAMNQDSPRIALSSVEHAFRCYPVIG